MIWIFNIQFPIRKKLSTVFGAKAITKLFPHIIFGAAVPRSILNKITILKSGYSQNRGLCISKCGIT